MGGNCDSLFIDSPPASLAYIYRSLGCFHSLQPDKDPFVSPSIPALTPQGFVRWQTVQLLLGPQEQVPFLQEAVKRFELKNAGNQGPFPRILPKESLPQQPDREMTEWHASVGNELRHEAEASQHPQRPSDLSSSTTDSMTDSSMHSAMPSFSFSTMHQRRTPPRTPYANIIPVSPSRRQAAPHPSLSPGNLFTTYPSQRRRSLGDTSPSGTPIIPSHRTGYWSRTQSPKSRPRSPSSSSSSSSESSKAPPIAPSYHPARPLNRADSHSRRHSAHLPYEIPRVQVRHPPPHAPHAPSQQARASHTLSPPFFPQATQALPPGMGLPPGFGYVQAYSVGGPAIPSGAMAGRGRGIRVGNGAGNISGSGRYDEAVEKGIRWTNKGEPIYRDGGESYKKGWSYVDEDGHRDPREVPREPRESQREGPREGRRRGRSHDDAKW